MPKGAVAPGARPSSVEWRDLPSEILFLLLRHAGARAAGGWARSCKSTYSTVELIRDHLFLSFFRDQSFGGVLCHASLHDNERLRSAKRYLSLLEEPDAGCAPAAEFAARATLPWCGSQLSLDILFLVQTAPHASSDKQGGPPVDEDTQECDRADERWGEELQADEKVRVLEVATVEQAFRCCLELAIHSELCTVDKALPRVAAKARAINDALRSFNQQETRREKEEATAKHTARLQVAKGRSAEAWVPAHVGLAMLQSQEAARGVPGVAEVGGGGKRPGGKKGMVAVDPQVADRELQALLAEATDLTKRLSKLKRAWKRVMDGRGGGSPQWLIATDERAKRKCSEEGGVRESGLLGSAPPHFPKC